MVGEDPGKAGAEKEETAADDDGREDKWMRAVGSLGFLHGAGNSFQSVFLVLLWIAWNRFRVIALRLFLEVALLAAS